MIPLHTAPDGSITFQLRLHPRAKKDAVRGEVGGAVKLSLTAPPVEGRANAALIAYLAERLRLPKASITIAAGQSSRTKSIRVAAPDAESRLRAWLAANGPQE